MPNVRTDDFRTVDGGTDWEALRRARVAAGENCQRCQRFLWFSTGSPGLCYECKGLDGDAGETDHFSLVRCPHCRHQFPPDEHLDEGDNELHCASCDRPFTVEASYSVSYTSPPLADAEDDKDEDADDTDVDDEGGAP